MIRDLHTHSTASDGRLPPQELLQRAAANGVNFLALTDHDTVAGVVHLQSILASQRQAGQGEPGVELVAGVEVTALFGKLCVHVVGLWIDTQSDALNNFLQQQREVRDSRGKKIALALEKEGIAGAYEGARAIAGEAILARPHFARYLVAQSICSTEQRAFNRYLGKRKIGDVRCEWPELGRAVAVIQQAGGRAVLAHPEKYKLTKTRLRDLLDNFAAAGGHGVEVVSGAQPRDSSAMLARLAEQRGLACSTGSDFHSPDQVWCDVGRQPPMPPCWQSIWQ